jgi:hypothetical protein
MLWNQKGGNSSMTANIKRVCFKFDTSAFDVITTATCQVL